MKIKAPGYRLLVKLKPVEKASKGGIVLVDNYVDKLQQATTLAEVIDIGPSCWWDVDGGKPWCNIGDTVCINKYSYKDVAYTDHDDDEESLYKMINDKDVIGVYKDE